MSLNISIIIPTYNRARYLGQTIESVFAMQVPEGCTVELLVIDNNCTDGSADIIRQKLAAAPFPSRHILETRQGLCFGRNRGISEAKHPQLVYLDDDICVNPRWLEGYIEAITLYEADAVVGPVFPIFEREKPPYLVGRVLDSISSGYSRRGDAILTLPPESGHELPGCNFGVRKAVAESIGGFDNTLDRVGKRLLAGGDFEFGQRLVAAGGRTVYHPLCSIDHIIAEEKLSKSYLRKRAFGSGATMRRMRYHRLSARTWCRRLTFTMTLALKSVWHRCQGRHQYAFELELQSRAALGMLIG